jgi:hypothetical protein
MALLNGYEREVCFFRELADRSRLRTPRCYYAEMDVDPLYERRPAIQRCIDRLPVGAMRMLLPLGRLAARASKRRYLVLMQDLAPARCGDQVEGCDLARAQQMSRCLAAFHASYWCDTSLIEKIWLPGIDLSPRGLQAIHRRSRRGFLRAHRDELPAQTIEACRFLDRHVEAVMQHLAGPPWTVLHGDYRLDNLLFNESTTWVTDFQGVCRGRPGYDLGYFICGSIDAGVDVRHVIDAYCEALRGHGIHDYTEADCRRDCTLSTLLQVYLYVATDDLIDMGTARGLRLIEVMRDRLFSRLPEPPYDTLL